MHNKKPEQTRSRLRCIAFFYLSIEASDLVRRFVRHHFVDEETAIEQHKT
ncbi:hypothetical protein DN30_3029 [Vibrio cholerae]|nr:hypothetical protein DN30_3029 [Vibrio cholerae]